MHVIAATIVTYRSPIEDVVRAVESFLATRLDAAITIVDNASGKEYVDRLKAAIGGKARLIEAPRNAGFGYGHNIGMLQAPQSEYYLVLNPDVRIHPGCLEALVDYMKAHPDVGVAGPKVLNEDGTLQPLNKRHPTVLDLMLRRFLPSFLMQLPVFKRRMEHYMMLDVGYGQPCDVEFLSGCCMLLRTSILNRLGGFDERFFMYLEDADLTRRAWEICKVRYVPDGVITHRWARGSHKKLSLMWVMVQSMDVYFTKWGVKWW